MHRQSRVVRLRMVGFIIRSLTELSTSGCIFISYGYLRRRQSNLSRPSESFHTRQVSYPVLVTVYHMLECHNMDIFPLVVGDYEAEKSTANQRQALFNDVEEEGWCLFTIDVRNSYGLPFEVTLERAQKGLGRVASKYNINLTVCHVDAVPASTTCTVAPGAMKRYMTLTTLTRPAPADIQ